MVNRGFVILWKLSKSAVSLRVSLCTFYQSIVHVCIKNQSITCGAGRLLLLCSVLSVKGKPIDNTGVEAGVDVIVVTSRVQSDAYVCDLTSEPSNSDVIEILQRDKMLSGELKT